ncbi:acyl-CoA dehydrogenase family protein [Crenobacter caeni]|uniref:Acyl-CoA/acyl-ACP dehydrogenase n=1 Tax=Crenobacter caeni TaxID=2705474 RepID=A0A6B2KRF6_9NEIS|nr:acyl-CoA dehydrogenase family protein [Crenobacter caeni]NDV12738.1 acyl-CoA/acyl-ACP dehydrogenase [Crenobacter caeni]
MDFQLNEEQRQIGELAQSLFADYGHERRAGELAREGWDAALWAQLQDTGLAALLLPAELGGAELGVTELALVLEAQGRALAAAPLWRHALAAATLSRFAPALLDAAGLTAPIALSLDTALTARLDGNRVLLSGQADAVAVTADTGHALLAVSLDGEQKLVCAPLASFTQQQGRLFTGETVVELSADNAALPAAQLLPATAYEWLEPRAMLAIAALQLGIAEGAQALTVAHLSEREQFGRKLGSFQAVAQRMADGFIAIEALRSVLWQLAWRLDAGAPIGTAHLTCKYWACEAGNRVAHTAQHLHGGTGSDTSYPVHRYYLAARVAELEMGGAARQIAGLAAYIQHNESWRAGQ